MKKLASYFGVSLSAAYKWSAETVRRKAVIMESGAEPEIIKLIGEISQLCYVFDCQNIKAAARAKTAKLEFDSDVAHLKIYQPDGRVIFSLPPIDLNQSTAAAELQKVKSTLESFVYGGA
jgi:hypothetical protein